MRTAEQNAAIDQLIASRNAAEARGERPSNAIEGGVTLLFGLGALALVAAAVKFLFFT